MSYIHTYIYINIYNIYITHIYVLVYIHTYTHIYVYKIIQNLSNLSWSHQLHTDLQWYRQHGLNHKNSSLNLHCSVILGDCPQRNNTSACFLQCSLWARGKSQQEGNVGERVAMPHLKYRSSLNHRKPWVGKDPQGSLSATPDCTQDQKDLQVLCISRDLYSSASLGMEWKINRCSISTFSTQFTFHQQAFLYLF